MIVALDGTPLVDRPKSPEAFHLLEWIELLREAGVDAITIWPSDPANTDLPIYPVRPRSGVWSRLRFQQQDLPKAAEKLGAELLVTSDFGVPLRSPCPIVAIGALGYPARGQWFGDSLTVSLGRAGARGARAALVPADLPSIDTRPTPLTYPPFVSRRFGPDFEQVPDPYVLCHGCGREDLSLVLAAWTWVEGSLGDSYPLLFAGADPEAEPLITPLAEDLDIAESVEILADDAEGDLVGLYRGAAALLGGEFPAGGQPLRWALAAGISIAATRTATNESIVGEAAYLVPAGDARTLGAACLTVLIQEPVADALREKSRLRAANLTSAEGAETLVDLLRGLVDSSLDGGRASQ